MVNRVGKLLIKDPIEVIEIALLIVVFIFAAYILLPPYDGGVITSAYGRIAAISAFGGGFLASSGMITYGVIRNNRKWRARGLFLAFFLNSIIVLLTIVIGGLATGLWAPLLFLSAVAGVCYLKERLGIY